MALELKKSLPCEIAGKHVRWDQKSLPCEIARKQVLWIARSFPVVPSQAVAPALASPVLRAAWRSQGGAVVLAEGALLERLQRGEVLLRIRVVPALDLSPQPFFSTSADGKVGAHVSKW